MKGSKINNWCALSFARNSYWNYFKSKSADYKDNVPDLKTESKVVYILNNKLPDSNFEGDLFQINDHNFITLQLITGKQLKNDYKLSGKTIGVVINTKMKGEKWLKQNRYLLFVYCCWGMNMAVRVLGEVHRFCFIPVKNGLFSINNLKLSGC